MTRTPSKPHIPYLGDDPTVGEKTGIQVARIKRTSDGFEPFNDLLSAGPSRLAAQEQDEGEDDGGMDNYDQQDNFGGQEEEDEEPVPSPKSSKTKAAPPAASTPKGKGRALSRVDKEEEEENEDDISRGMEDVDQGESDDEPEEASRRKHGRSRTTEKPEVIDASNPEAGLDGDTNPTAVVLDYHTNGNVTRRVAFTAKMFNPKPAKVKGRDAAWSFEKIFGDGDFMGAGQLVIPVGKRKPRKGTKDNTYIFYVVEGAVNVVICDTSFVLATGGMFMVPQGNTYSIENIADRDSKLFFTQARKMREDEKEESEPVASRGMSA